MPEYVYVEYEGTKIRLSNLEKKIWEKEDITKAELIKYYVDVGEYILKYLKDRLLTVIRCPDTINDCFFQKDLPDYAPPWIKTYTKGNIRYPICNDLRTLIWLTNFGTVDYNPTLSRVQSYDAPDLCVFDLDPFKPCNFKDTLEIALIIKDLLKELNIKGFPKTSGATGMQIYVPIKGHDFKEAKFFVRKIGELIESKHRKVTTYAGSVSKRKGKVFIDFLQNDHGKTVVAPYSLRPLPNAPVSTPLNWREIEKGDIEPSMFNISTILERLKEKGDLFEEIYEDQYKLPREILNK